MNRYPSGSVEWLLEAVESQEVAEQEALAQFEYVRGASGDPVIDLVIQLVVEDQARHRALLKRIESTLRDVVNWTHSADALPVNPAPREPVTQTLLDAANALTSEEHLSGHYLRDIAHREKDVGSGLESVLIEMMAMDTDKHARLLQFVGERLARRACRYSKT